MRKAKDATATSAAELKRLRAENKALRRQIEQIKTKVRAKFAEIQRGLKARMDKDPAMTPASKAGVMEYVKAGFFSTLGVIAAIAVVDVVAEGADDLFSEGEDAAAGAADDDAFVESLFEGGGGRKTTTKNKKTTTASVATKKKTNTK